VRKKRLHFVGPVLTGSGYGVHARQLLLALHRAGDFDLTVESLRWGETPFLNDPELEWIRELAAKKPHAQPDVCVEVTIPSEFRRRAPLTIGVTAGIETDRVSPQWLMQCNKEVDLVIVPSEHSRRGFLVEYQGNNGEKLHLEKPIIVVPEGVDTSVYHPMAVSSGLLDELKVPQKNFVFVGLGLDKPQGRDRKNVSRLVEWFCKAFAGRTDVGLILKTAIVNSSTVDFEVTRKRIEDIKNSVGGKDVPIFLIHGRVPDEQLAAIYNDPRVIASVSVTHGEGFGLPLIEAAASGVPVMATDWSGHLDFLTKNGRKLFVPFEYDLQAIYPESANEWMIQGTGWAVPKETDVITKLQKMALSSTTPRTWAKELAIHVADAYSLKRTGDAFVNLVRQGAEQATLQRPTSREDFVSSLREKVRQQGPSLVYTMPMSAGDVFLSISVVNALRKRHRGHRVYFATSGQYFPIAKGCADELIEWQPWMQDVGLLEEIFDEVYTPNLAVQMAWSNWVHRGRGRNLIDEFAAQCGLDPKELEAPRMLAPNTGERSWSGPSREGSTWLALHSGGQKSARAYAHWRELVKNLRAAGVKVVQVGGSDDTDVGEVDWDMRGKLAYDEFGTFIYERVDALLGIDSFPMHVAAAYGKPVVALFGSSYVSTTGPRDFKLKALNDMDTLVHRDEIRKACRRLTLLETPDRNGCDRACYKDTCRVDSSNPCINNITPREVYYKTLEALELAPLTYQEYRPKISGYTHILNPKTHGYPFVQSILSMMDFCDEVVVVDGGSTDGSVEFLQAELEQLLGAGRPKAVNHDCRLNIVNRQWDPDEPGMDGMQKAFGRAMCSPDSEFLWQQDADEVVHEDDYAKIIDLCRRFPSDVDVIHLPVVELWGDDRTVRTDRHSWKWRLSRNNVRVTHGINIHARTMDPKTGRIYSKPGMSDGCEYIDIVSGEHLPHKGFYTKELEAARVENPEEYGRIMNDVFHKLPSVWHYSWADLPRKVRNFRDFWDKQWQVLYQSPPQPRFPDVVSDEDITRKAEELRERGGEHGRAPTFKIDLAPPEVMR